MALELVVDGSHVTERAQTFPERARAIRITDALTYASAGEFLLGIKALRGEIADTFDPHIERAHKAHKALLDDKRKAEAPLAEAERVVKDALVAYDREQERLRREEQLRQQEEARRQEEERRLLDAIELEEAARATGDEGLKAQAEALIDEPITVPAVAVASTTPKVAGITYRETWSARVENLHALVRFVAANPQFIGLLQANQTALNGQARSLKGAMQIPGVVAFATRDVAAGRR